ncbi:Interferon regulatory factor [Porites harrisoni]
MGRRPEEANLSNPLETRGSRHGWSEKDDAALFRAWATYTGKYKEGRDLPDPRKWKTNFRCALNALPDIKEIREESCPGGKDAYKIYKMQPVRGRGLVFIPSVRCPYRGHIIS